MLAHLVHHTDDLQRPDAPLIALVTESALTVGQAGVELRPSFEASCLQVPSRSCTQLAGSVPRRRGVGTAFALEKQCFSACLTRGLLRVPGTWR